MRQISDREFTRRLRRMEQLRAKPADRLSPGEHDELDWLETWQANFCRTLPRQLDTLRHRLTRYTAFAETLGLA